MPSFDHWIRRVLCSAGPIGWSYYIAHLAGLSRWVGKVKMNMFDPSVWAYLWLLADIIFIQMIFLHLMHELKRITLLYLMVCPTHAVSTSSIHIMIPELAFPARQDTRLIPVTIIYHAHPLVIRIFSHLCTLYSCSKDRPPRVTLSCPR
jgi:hypothetical protein